MTIQYIDEAKFYSKAVVHNGVAYISGQIPTNTPDGSFEEQTKDVFAALDSVMQTAGTDKSKLLSVTIYLADMDDFAAFNPLYLQWLDGLDLPSRATVQAALVAPQYKIEIAAIAAV